LFLSYESSSSSSPPPPPPPPPKIKRTEELQQIRASHLLVKHAGSRRPSSWRQQNITISVQEAPAQIQQYRHQILESEEPPIKALSKLAQRYSDCSSASRGGDLGQFKRGSMQQAFEDAAFQLQVGELSSVVETASGFHLIIRTQ